MTRNVIRVTSDQLEQFAAESGQTITIRPEHALLTVGSRVFVAPLPPIIPAQRKGGEES